MTPVIKGYCTLRELQEYYSLRDLADMVEAAELEAHVNSLTFEPEEETVTKLVVG